MSTLIISKDSSGLTTRRCNARCYNAKGSVCKYICGAINHGLGKEVATYNTIEHRDFLKDAQNAGEFILKTGQYQLFPGGKQ